MTFDRLTLPGKVFILGEYAVLDGCSAWVAAVPPRFRFEFSKGAASSKNEVPLKNGGASGEKDFPFHPESPAGRFFATLDPIQKDRVASALSRGRWIDAWEGQGGFGGSTAEFAVIAYLAGIRDPLEAHAHYLSLFPADRRPSGADLVAQWVGGVIEWTPAKASDSALMTGSPRGSFRKMDDDFRDLPFVLFSATHLPERKTKTYAHLETVSRAADRFTSLAPILELARSGMDRKDLRTLGSALTRYAETLSELGLESETAHSDRLAISERPGVLGVKGCGALQTDALVVLLENYSFAEDLISFAHGTLGLRLVAKGLTGESGLREEVLA